MCRKVQTLKNKLEVKHTNGFFSTSAKGMNRSNAKYKILYWLCDVERVKCTHAEMNFFYVQTY